MSNNQLLTPSYLDTDFDTLRQRFVDELSKLDSFKDYDFEGSNTSLLIEMTAYLSELNTYYLNKIAKNIYDDTADIYENVHRLATFRGYQPKGWISAQTDVDITISQETSGQYFEPGDQIYVPAWYKLSTEDDINFITTRSYLGTIPSSASLAYQTSFSVKQGDVSIQNYKGSDIVDNQLMLPFYQFDHDDNIEDDKISIELIVNGIPWTRVEDFYYDVSGLLDTSLVYTFNYDKYQRYVIEFSDSKTVPADSDIIQITLIKSLGPNGNVAAGSITASTVGLVYNNTKQIAIPINNITITNPLVTDPGSEPQTMNDIKKGARGFLNAQYRCVTKNDYISFLQSKADVIAANAWGEKDVNPNGDVREYNKVHITAIPISWGTGTVAVSASVWTPFSGVTGSIYIPTEFSSSWQETLKTFLEPRKMLNAYEQFDVPSLVYFAFNLGIRVKRSYSFVDIIQDVKDKLTYYFETLKEFGGTINFIDITNYIVDTSQMSSTNSFSNIKGIDSIIFRDIASNYVIYDYGSDLFPQWTQAEFNSTIDNKMKSVQLGFTQYPMFLSNLCLFTQEI